MEEPVFVVRRKKVYPVVTIAFTLLMAYTLPTQWNNMDWSIRIVIFVMVLIFWLGLYFLYHQVNIYSWGIEQKWWFSATHTRWEDIKGYYTGLVAHEGVIRETAQEIHLLRKHTKKPLIFNGFFISNMEELFEVIKKYIPETEPPENTKRYFTKNR